MMKTKKTAPPETQRAVMRAVLRGLLPLIPDPAERARRAAEIDAEEAVERAVLEAELARIRGRLQ